MSRVCTVNGKKPHFGNNVSHANNKTRRRWQPNLQVCSFPSEILGKSVAIRLTANGIRTVEHNGGLDAWLLTTNNSRLSETALKIKKQLAKAQARTAKASVFRQSINTPRVTRPGCFYAFLILVELIDWRHVHFFRIASLPND